MKRHNESSDEREPKRAKIANLSEDPLLPPEILQKIVQYACHEDFKTASRFLQSAKLFEDVLSEESWKLLYVLRWHRKILGEDGDNYSDEEIISEIEQHLSVEPNDYVDTQFYGENAWQNRYKCRSQLENEGRRVSDEDDLCTADLLEVGSCSFAIYNLDSDDTDKETNVQYSNLAKIEEINKSQIREAGPRRNARLIDNRDDKSNIKEVYHAIFIAHTGAPVKVRLETLDGRDRMGGVVLKKYFNTRIMAYNYKNQIWDIISAQYCNYAVDEDEINYYKPYCMEFSNALFVEEKHVPTPGRRKTSYEKDYNGDLFKIICAAAEVSEEHIRSNTDAYVDLDAENEEEEDQEHGSEEDQDEVGDG